MSPKITGEILGLRQSAPDAPVGFSQVWSLKTLWDSREDVLNQKYLELLDTTLENPEHSEVESPGTKPQYIKSLFNLEEEFRNLARYTGLVTEPLNKELLGFEKLSPLNLLEKFKKLFVKSLIS